MVQEGFDGENASLVGENFKVLPESNFNSSLLDGPLYYLFRVIP